MSDDPERFPVRWVDHEIANVTPKSWRRSMPCWYTAYCDTMFHRYDDRQGMVCQPGFCLGRGEAPRETPEDVLCPDCLAGRVREVPTL